MVTDEAIPVFILVRQRNAALGDDLGHVFLERVGQLGDVSGDACVLFGEFLRGNQFGSDRAVGLDRQFAEIFEFGARLRQNDLLAVLIGNLLNTGNMIVAVQHGVDTGGVGDDSLRGPAVGDTFVAKVTHCDDVVSARSSYLVNSLLDSLIKRCASLVFTEGIDVASRFILEVSRGGLGEGLRRNDADECDLLIAVGHDLIRLVIQIRRAFADVLEVARQILILRLLGQLGQLWELVVKFMVAEGGKIIADLIHDIDQIGACGQCADRLALNSVAAINECDIVVCFLHLGLVCRDTGITKIVVDAAVCVVGM